jgi:phosphoglycerol transferase MdoB-like AlkP superfamily enzyme
VKRVIYLLKFYGVTVLLFIVAKVVFMLSNGSAQSFTVGDLLSVISHGLSLDLSTALYFFSLPFLLTIVAVWVKLPRWLYQGYYGLMALAFALAFVADTSLYSFWQFKLDASCLQYLETPTEAMASVSVGYLLVRLLMLVAVVVLIYLAYWLAAKPALTDSPTKQRLLPRIVETVGYVLLIPVIVIGIRGGLGESTTNIGQVYFSQNQFLNHSAVNPVFSFLSSIGKSGDYIVSYDEMSDAECRALTDGLFPTESQDPDTLLNTTRPHIVLIVMESCGGQFTELGGHPEITPRMNTLSREGVYFTECYANSWRTDKGVVSILSGYPAFPVTSVMKIPEKSRKLPSIAASLQAEGYATSFYYGGDINFTNMRSYVMGSGYQQLKWKADYSSDDQQSAQWGVRDDLMFADLLRDIQSENNDRPWFKTLLTLSSHEPWDVPTKVLDDEVYNAFNYLDNCIGNFIDSLKQLPVWDNLLVVILPDHGYRYLDINEATRLYNHIPLIWAGGAVRQPTRVEAVCNQSDLAATLLGQLQIPHSAFTFSRDVVSKNYVRPMAWHTSTSCVSVFDSLGFTAYDLDAQTIIAHEGEQQERQLQLARALLQLTSHDLIAK